MANTLTWQQVNTWRLAQHGLAPRWTRQDVVKIAARTGGIQAQVLSAAELALWARAEGLERPDVQKALWQDHTLIKTWAMRGTLHLLAAEDLPLFAAARSNYDGHNWAGYFAYYGLTSAQHAAFIEAVPQVLGDKPLTREQLAAAVTKATGASMLYDLIVSSGWGSPLKPSAFRDDLCFGPSQGQNVTFVNPRVWIGTWREFEPQQAMQEIVRRYLRAYAPATTADFGHWWLGGGTSIAKQVFKALGDTLEEVEVEGWKGWALRDTVSAMQEVKLDKTVHLLPLFDALPLGLGRDIEPFLPMAHKAKVFRPQGWISAVVLVNGDIKGVWEYKTKGKQTAIKVRPFAKLNAAIKKGIAAEAERLGKFLNTSVLVEYE